MPLLSEGIEVILLLASHTIKNEGVFNTDSNGLKMIQRKVDQKPDFDVETTGHQIEANYYPINAGITISDVETGRTMG